MSKNSVIDNQDDLLWHDLVYRATLTKELREQLHRTAYTAEDMKRMYTDGLHCGIELGKKIAAHENTRRTDDSGNQQGT